MSLELFLTPSLSSTRDFYLTIVLDNVQLALHNFAWIVDTNYTTQHIPTLPFHKKKIQNMQTGARDGSLNWPPSRHCTEELELAAGISSYRNSSSANIRFAFFRTANLRLCRSSSPQLFVCAFLRIVFCIFFVFYFRYYSFFRRVFATWESGRVMD